MRRAIGVALLAALVLSAGCVGGIGGAVPTTGSADGGETGAGDDGERARGSVDGPAGTVEFYVSDRPNDMDDFEHLNVTITSVRFHLVDPADAGNATATPADATVTATSGTDTETATATSAPTATPTPDATPAGTPAGATEAADETPDESDEPDGDRDRDRDQDRDGNGRWVVRDVNATTVDLTRLRGANATLLAEFDLPAGEYDKVFLDVGDVNGTLTSGESARVKLPSGKLHLDVGFEVASGSETEFVYDVSVHEAGKSGKYILKPVVGESGPDREIRRVDDRGRTVGSDDGDRAERPERTDDSPSQFRTTPKNSKSR